MNWYLSDRVLYTLQHADKLRTLFGEGGLNDLLNTQDVSKTLVALVLAVVILIIVKGHELLFSTPYDGEVLKMSRLGTQEFRLLFVPPRLLIVVR